MNEEELGRIVGKHETSRRCGARSYRYREVHFPFVTGFDAAGVAFTTGGGFHLPARISAFGQYVRM